MSDVAPSALRPTPSPIAQFHLAAGAKMADFGGWSMPIEYPGADGGVMAEHRAVRERVGIFDVSHLGKIAIKGAGALEFLNRVLTNDLAILDDGDAQYTLICNDEGGVVDDLIAYRFTKEHIFLIPNAANCERLYRILVAEAPDGIHVTNLHKDLAVFAIQGPRSKDLLASISLEVPAALKYMSFITARFKEREVIICRTGYTGEQGFEVVSPVEGEVAMELWNQLVQALPSCGGTVAGLGARDTLRTEMGYALHGHELSSEINPFEAGVGWAVAENKAFFIGREALLRKKSEGIKRRSRALRSLDRSIPRPGMIVKEGETEIGVVTSGTFSPNLKAGIALALIDSRVKIGETLTIDVRGREGRYEVVKAPFVPSHVR